MTLYTPMKKKKRSTPVSACALLSLGLLEQNLFFFFFFFLFGPVRVKSCCKHGHKRLLYCEHFVSASFCMKTAH